MKLALSALVFLLVAVPQIAYGFDLIVPATARMRVNDLNALTTPHWGWVVATDAPILCSQLPQGNTPASDDHPQLEFFTSAFSNCNQYSPIMPGSVLGMQGDQTAVLTPFLHPGEVLIRPGLAEPAWGVREADGVTDVTVTVQAHYQFGNQRADYTVQIEFVSEGLLNRLEVLTGQRVSSVTVNPTGVETSTWGGIKALYL